MKSSDFRNYAREKLKGKWGKVAKITLSYLFISIIFAIIGIPGIYFSHFRGNIKK